MIKLKDLLTEGKALNLIIDLKYYNKVKQLMKKTFGTKGYKFINISFGVKKFGVKVEKKIADKVLELLIQNNIKVQSK